MFDIRPYQFLQWDRNTFCCGDYALKVLSDHFSCSFKRFEYSGGVIEASIALKSTPLRKLFRPIAEPKPYCVIEMQRYKSPDHVGVCVEVNGKLMITHCENGSGVLLSTFAEIQEHYKIVGYYEYVQKSPPTSS